MSNKYFEGVVESDFKHKHYQRTVDFADKYLKLFTGENIDTLLKQFAMRESPAMFEQRKRLYKSVMPAVASNLDNVFKKGIRATGVYASIFATDDKDNGTGTQAKIRSEKLENVIAASAGFYKLDGETGVESWLNAVWYFLAEFDPNAFLIIDFLPFDEATETAQPFPVVFYSSEVIDFKYVQNHLEYFCGRKAIKYLSNGQMSDGWQYFLYKENTVEVLTQIGMHETTIDAGGREDGTYELVVTKNGKWIYEIKEHKTGEVPAMRVGVKYDPNTKSQTCLSIFHSALPFFEKELKSGSELDITMALHTFPQKVAFGRLCPGDQVKNIPCRGGTTPMGHMCEVCKGTGTAPIHTSGQDVLLIPMPTGHDATMPDLNNVIAYVTPSMDLIKFQNDYVDTLTEKARKAIFGGTTMIQKQSTTTATEADYAMDDIYDGLHTFLSKYSAMWIFINSIIARQLDAYKEVGFYHKFPNDLKMKSAAQLYNERKAAKDSGAPSFVLNFIDEDIIEQQYRDDADTLNKIRVQNSFIPFKGKDAELVASSIARGRVPKEIEILYLYSDLIFREIESKVGNAFYFMTYEKQKGIVAGEVAIIISKIESPEKLNTEISAEV